MNNCRNISSDSPKIISAEPALYYRSGKEYVSRRKPGKPLPRTPQTPSGRKVPSLQPRQSTSAEASRTIKAQSPSQTTSHAVPVPSSSTNPHRPLATTFVSRHPFPPRRPVQRSVYASESVPTVGPTSPLFHPHSPTRRVHPGHVVSHPVSSTTAPANSMSAAATQLPLISPLKSLFDNTWRGIYSEMMHFQSTCLAMVNRERKEKDIIRAHYLKMQRERDVARERARELEETRFVDMNHVSSVTKGRGVKRQRADEGESIQLPSPPTSCSSSSGIVDSPANTPTVSEIDAYALTCPARSTASPSPPPPPISGRQLYFLQHRDGSLSPAPPSSSPRQTSFDRTSSSSPVHFTSSYVTAGHPSSRKPNATVRQEEKSGVVLGEEVCGSPQSDSDEEIGLYPPMKKRRISSSSESSDSSGVTLVEEDVDNTDGARFMIIPRDTERPHVRVAHSFSDAGLGECDMDLESDSDAESISSPRSCALGTWSDDDDIHLTSLPSSSSTVTAEEPSQKPALPILNLTDLAQMYVQYGGKVYCRSCSSRKPDTLWNCASPLPPMDANHPSLDALVEHCTNEHPVAYSDVAGLTLDQVFKLQKILKANKLSGIEPPPSESQRTSSVFR